VVRKFVATAQRFSEKKTAPTSSVMVMGIEAGADESIPAFNKFARLFEVAKGLPLQIGFTAP
jgi:hypothetical protein